MLTDLQRFSNLLDELSKAAKLNFSWHFVNQEWLNSVVPAQRGHDCFFCRQIKGAPSRKLLRTCIKEHHETGFFKSLKLQDPYIIHCHAGAMELAVPLFLKDEFSGVLYVGTFRSSGHCAYAGFEKIYKNLPEIREEQLLAWGTVLQSLISRYLGNMNASASGQPLLPQMLCRDNRILNAVIMIKQKFARPIKASEAAKAAGMSISRFLHAFPQETGYSFSDFLQRVRVDEARRFVAGSDLPLGEIAERSGIGSQTRMGVLFHRYLGTSPRELRKSYRSRFISVEDFPSP